jgi:hypothetical protein
MSVPMVELHNHPTIGYKLLVIGTAVAALTAEDSLIPPAAQFDITNCNEWLRIH